MIQKIDIHTHVLFPGLPNYNQKFGYDGFLRFECDGCNGKMLWSDGRFIRNVEQNGWDPATRLKECDEQGVKIQVLSSVPALFSYFAKGEDGLEVCRFVNDNIAKIVATNPDRFLGLGNLPMQSPKLAIKEVERCVRELKFPGVQIGTHVNDWNLSAPELFPVFEAISELGACVFVHPWDMMGSERMQKYWLPWLVGMPAETSLAICSLIFGGVFRRLPKLRVAFAHGGGAFPGTFGRIEQGFKGRPDLCAVDNDVSPREYLGRFFVDTIVFEPEMLDYCVSLLGEDSLCLGSDYPFPLGEEHPGKLVMSMKWGDGKKKKVLHDNALRWLGRPA